MGPLICLHGCRQGAIAGRSSFASHDRKMDSKWPSLATPPKSDRLLDGFSIDWGVTGLGRYIRVASPAVRCGLSIRARRPAATDCNAILFGGFWQGGTVMKKKEGRNALSRWRSTGLAHRRHVSPKTSECYLNPGVQGGYRVHDVDFAVESKNLGFTHRLAKCIPWISEHFLNHCGIKGLPKAGGFGLRLKARLIGHPADHPPSQNRERG